MQIYTKRRKRIGFRPENLCPAPCRRPGRPTSAPAAPPHRPARTTARPGRENNPAARADKSADRISRPADKTDGDGDRWSGRSDEGASLHFLFLTQSDVNEKLAFACFGERLSLFLQQETEVQNRIWRLLKNCGCSTPGVNAAQILLQAQNTWSIQFTENGSTRSSLS